MEETTENNAANKDLEKTLENGAANKDSEKTTKNDTANKEPEKTTKNDTANKEPEKTTKNDVANTESDKMTENDAADKVSEKLDTEEGDSPGSPGFHDFLEDDFLESLAVVDSWKAEDEEMEPQENKEKVYSHSRCRPSRDRVDRKDRRSSERNRTDPHRSRRRSRNRGLSYRNDPYSRSRYSPSLRSGYNDRSPKDNRSSSRTRSTTERYQRKSPDDVKSKRDQNKEDKLEAKIEDTAGASSPCETLVKTEENATQDDTASTSVPPPKLSSESPVAIDTCIKEITDVVPPGTEEEFVNLSKNVGVRSQGFPDSEWNKRDLPRSEHKQIEKNDRKRSPTEYARRPPEREYKHGDYFKRYGSREIEPIYRNRSQSKELHLPQRSRSRERQTSTNKRRSRSRERQMPIKRRSRSRERQMPTTKARSRSRERQQPTIKARSRSRERQMSMKRRSRSRERQTPTVKRRSRSRERQTSPIKRRSRSRERQITTVKRRSRSREGQTPTIKRRSQSRERSLETQKKKLRKKREKRSPSIKKLKSSWNAEKKAKGTSGRPYANKKKDSHKVMDPELSPVSGTSLSSPSLSLSPVSSDGERWRRRKSDHSPLSLSPARSYISLSSEHSDRSPKRKRSPFWREIQRTFAAQDMAKSHFVKIPPPQQQSYYQSKPPPAQPVSYPTELYPSSAPNYPPPAANYYQPPPMQPPPPGDFMVSSATAPMMVPPVSAPMMVPPVSAPMMVPPVSTPMMVPPVSQMTPITYPPPPCPVPPPAQPVASLQLEPPDPAMWPQPVIEHAGTPKWVPEHGGIPNWEPEKPDSALKWEPKNNDGAIKWESEKYDPAKNWEPDKREAPSAPKWEPQKRGKAPKWKPEKHSGSSKREPKRCDEDEELIPPPPPTISQPEKSLSSLLEASAKAGVTQKKPSSVEHNVVNRCEEALRTLSAERGLVLPSSGNFIFHRDNGPPKPISQESTSRFQSPLLRNPIPMLDFTEPSTSDPSSYGIVIKVKEEGEGKKSSLLVKAAAKLASKEMSAHPSALHGEVPLCLNCAEREKKKFVDCSSQTSVASRTVALQCDNVRGEIKAYFEPEFDNNAPLGYRRYQPLPQPPKGILKSSRH